MKNELKKLNGSVLGIGLSEKEQEILKKNEKVVECYFLDSNSANKTKLKGRGRTVNIKNIKRIFRKKSLDYIIVNFEEIKPYLRSFIKNSIYLNKDKIYFYNIKEFKEFDFDELEKRYIRYNSEVEKKRDILIVDNKNTKTNIFKNTIYSICDLICDVLDYIGKLLVS